MRINYNVSAMLSNNALANNDKLLAASLERLSSGLKINHAKDNPAGLAMAKRMNAQMEGVKKAGQNASDGVSVLETADGALGEVHEMLQRMSELAIKASNGTMTDDDRKVIQDEVEQLKAEIQRVRDTTEFNGQHLFNGEFAYKGYTDDNRVKVNSYSADVALKEYTIDSIKVEKELDAWGNETGNLIVNEVTLGEGFDDSAKLSFKDNMVIITADDNFEMKLDLTKMLEDSADVSDLKIDISGVGAMRLQVGANEGQIIPVDIPDLNIRNLGIEKLDVSTPEGAKEAIGLVEDAIKEISHVRGRLGAFQNRLESTVDTLNITDYNMTSAYSRIMDVDMAEEMTAYTTAQVLTQAGTSMLAQANERPSQVLQLLQ
ncbi:MAG: flagellin FliC3 [Lachnospiraceae bacterium]|nr:flagellin FliC3 [Lachnospiraceae bacterium]